MTSYVVSPGQTSSGLTITSNDDLTVQAGGTASGTSINGGDATIESGGVAADSVISGFGIETVLSGGMTLRTSVLFGSVEAVSGGLASAFSVGSLGLVDDFDGGVDQGGTVLFGGRENLLGGLAVGTTVASGGVQNVNTGSAVQTMVQSGGIEAIQNTGAVVSGTTLAAGGRIDLTFLAPDPAGTVTLDAGDVLTVTENGSSYTQVLAGDYTGEYFHLTADYARGSFVTLDTMPCYCPGTRLLGPAGELVVEALRPGDFVVTARGEVRPVRWVGRRSYAARSVAGNRAVWPVVIAAGALGGGLPRRDLLVSPEHALFLDGLLVPASALLNGSTIVQRAPRGRVEYVHVELDSHDILLAEGVPAESYVDDGNREAFANAAEPGAPPLDASRPPARYCAPRADSGPDVEAVRRRIARVAEALLPAV